MLQVIVGVVLTAVLGGLLIPLVKEVIDHRRDTREAYRELLEVLATGLWSYWALAHRVAYYGRQGDASAERFALALNDWDSAESWKVGRDIRIQVSRAKRLIPKYQPTLDKTQANVVQGLDRRVETLRGTGSPAEWGEFFECLMSNERDAIDGVLGGLTKELRPHLVPPLMRHLRWPREPST